MGADLVFTGSQYYDGDNSNQNAKLPGHWTVNLRAGYEFSPAWQIFGVVNNLFDRHDAPPMAPISRRTTPAGLVTPALTDPRTVTLEQPISVQIGVKLKL